MGCKSCDTPKPKHRKGLWSPEEDQRLRSYMLKHGLGCWSAVPGKTGLQRNGKSCRLRWINYLRPGLKRGVFTMKEEETILTLHELLGNKWSQIATHLPGRTDNEIKNYWNSYLKKKTIKLGFEPETSTATVASQPSQTPNVQISKFEFPVPTESNQTSPTNSNILDSYAGAENQKGPPPPKLFLFTEWLTSHCGASWSFADSDESTFPDGNSISSSTEELFKQEIFNFEGPMVGPVYQPGSGYGELQPEFMPESGFPAGGFYDLFSVGDFSSDFTMNQKM